MSERSEKARRLNLRIKYVSEFNEWLSKEPPMWKFWLWFRWKSERPKFIV